MQVGSEPAIVEVAATWSDEPRAACAPPVRVLHLLPDLALGGGQSIVLQHVRHADVARFTVEVAWLGGDDAMAPLFEMAGTPPIPLDTGRRGTGANVIRLRHLLRDHGVDILHVHSAPDRKLGQIAAFLTGAPVVSHLHGAWVHLGVHLPDHPSLARRAQGELAGRGRDWLERRTVRHYVAESAAVERLFRPLVSKPISVLHQAVPVDEIDAARSCHKGERLRAPLGIAPDAPVLLTVARMVDGKGHEDLVSMFRTVRGMHPDARLVMVGDGPRRPVVEAAIAGAEVGDAVLLLGDRFDVPDLLSMATVFVFASSTEGFGLVALEAMAASLPVVAYDLPAFREFMVDGVTADLAPLGDASELASRVSGLLDDRGRARRMGVAGRAIVDERFPAGSVARVFEQVYDDVMATR